MIVEDYLPKTKYYVFICAYASGIIGQLSLETQEKTGCCNRSILFVISKSFINILVYLEVTALCISPASIR